MRAALVTAIVASFASSLAAPAAAQPARRDVDVQVAVGETLWSLAQRFDVPVQNIRSANRLGSDHLQAGQHLHIPGALASARAPEAAATGGVYVVREGETFSSIASSHAIGMHALRRANPGVRELSLRPGMELHLPAGARVTRAEAIRTPSPARTRKQRAWIERAARIGLGTNRAASQILAGQLEPQWKRTVGRGAPPRSFRWPAPRGWFVRGFGSGRHNGHLAIDIMAPRGQRVIAADAGLVAYADDGIRGYGQMVLLLHPGGWATAYAHNSEMIVVPGQRVRRGEQIARVGQTGNARGPHVHFMWITEGGQYCDPLALFRPYGRHRDGRRIRVPPITVQGVIPPTVHCRVRPARIDDSVSPEDDEEGLEPATEATPETATAPAPAPDDPLSPALTGRTP